MFFPLKKKSVGLTNSKTEFLDSYREVTEIPLLPHPGAFAKIRKNHQHEGIDLYCEAGDEVIAMENGIVLDIFQFTGKAVNMGWWNDTWAILIKGDTGVFNYGELIPESHLSIGQQVKAGEVIGKITTVLKEDKGRPMNMLHLEMYHHHTIKALTSWDLGMDKPDNLLDPTQILLKIVKENKLMENDTIEKMNFSNKKNKV